MPDTEAIIKRNLAALQARIAAACGRARRNPADVTLIAVTKYHNAEIADAVVATGVADIGENRLQTAEPKFAAMTTRPKRHFIGELQRNKVKRVLELFDVIHSLDRMELAKTIEQRATDLGRASVDCFVEVNVSGEASKSGFTPEKIFDALKEIATTAPRVRVVGLMTMAPASDNAENARPYFAGLRQLRDKAQAQNLFTPDRAGLSMGMSGDFEVAVEEDATHVRIGTALYEGIPK